jgi:hypothetical protein
MRKKPAVDTWGLILYTLMVALFMVIVHLSLMTITLWLYRKFEVNLILLFLIAYWPWVHHVERFIQKHVGDTLFDRKGD